MQRYVTSLLPAIFVTLGLLTIMQRLVGTEGTNVLERPENVVIEFVRAERDSEVRTKQRQRPQLKDEAPPPPPQMRLDQTDAPKQALAVSGPAFDPNLSLAGGPHLGAAADTDVIPLVRVNPRYPPRAQARGVEGWVHLRFSITPQGTTRDIEVLDADPRGYFERAAMNAVKKYKYKPRIEDGEAVSRQGVEVVISFELEG